MLSQPIRAKSTIFDNSASAILLHHSHTADICNFRYRGEMVLKAPLNGFCGSQRTMLGDSIRTLIASIPSHREKSEFT
ncbi:MAG: hypothetical protein DSY81_01255 [Bacillota bacterium]|nr:MAG: hypothetical protein DSY81_01255 [Bacillota bacterium]